MIDEFIITNLIEKEGKRPFGFARRIRDAEEVFIPPRVAEANDLKMHTKIYASIVRSHLEGGCPLVIDYIYDEAGAFAALLSKVNTQSDANSLEPELVEPNHEPSNAEIADQALQYVRSQARFVTTAQVTSHLGRHFNYPLHSKAIARILHALHEEGHICRASLNKNNVQSRSSKVVHGAPYVYDQFVELLTGQAE